MKYLQNIFNEFNWDPAISYPTGTLQKTLRDDENGKTVRVERIHRFVEGIS